MNYPLVIKVLGYTLWVEAGCMVLPLLSLALLPRSSGRCGMSDAGSKLMMILWMLLGRLELMPILVMLSPGTWKER